MYKGFIGRKNEVERLKQCMEMDQAQLIVVYGRRRVGKTFLIESFFDGNFDFSFTGSFNRPKSVQLMNFAEEIRFQTGMDVDTPDSWRKAFVILRKYLSSLDKGQKHVVFLDELPWMDTHKSEFLPAFEWFWNGWGSKQRSLVMIVCGSATSWMINNISDNKGGLFNRHTCRLYLEPFNLSETEEFLYSRDIRWSRIEIAECYMIMGGMPYYLNLLNSQLSFRNNIDHLFFKRKGELWDEFRHLYHTLFSNGNQYIKVAETLSQKTGGLTRKELSEKSGIKSSNIISRILEDLINSGFVRVYSFYGHKKRDSIYQLCDYYSLFYFKFLKDQYGVDENFWSKSFDNPQRRAWCGLTFEQLCKDHMKQIKKTLGIPGVITEESTWYIRARDMSEEISRGAQIDILIDRRDMVINICEVKFSMNEYEINKDYDLILRNKIETFRRATDCKKTLALTMITTFGVKKNRYGGIVNDTIVLDDLFENA